MILHYQKKQILRICHSCDGIHCSNQGIDEDLSASQLHILNDDDDASTALTVDRTIAEFVTPSAVPMTQAIFVASIFTSSSRMHARLITGSLVRLQLLPVLALDLLLPLHGRSISTCVSGFDVRRSMLKHMQRF